MRVSHLMLLSAFAASVTALALNSSLAQDIKRVSDKTISNVDLHVITRRVESAESRVAKLQPRIAKVEADIANATASLDLMTKHVTTLTADMAALDSDIALLLTHVSEAVAAASAQAAAFQKLQVRAHAAHDDLNQIQIRIFALEEKYKNLESSVHADSVRMTSAAQTIQDAQNKLHDLQATNAQTSSGITTQETKAISNASSILTLSSNISINAGALELTESNQTSNESEELAMITNKNAWVSEIKALNQTIAINSKTVTKHNKRLRALEKHYS
jgi:chromosome segregation ATPase